MLHSQIGKQKVFNAYAHFEALSNRIYQFNCILCGYYPSILMADLNRKVVFMYESVEDDLPDINDANTDYLNCEDFWKGVLSNI